MKSKFCFLATLGVLAQVFFGIPSGAAVPTIPAHWDIKKIDAETERSKLGEFVTLSDVLLYQKIKTNNTITCYEKKNYETLIEKFVTNWKKAVSKYGAYLDCRYGEIYRKAEGCLKYIIEAVEAYPKKLESWLEGDKLASLGPDFSSIDSKISLCDLEVTIYMKAMLKEIHRAPKKFYEMIDDSRKEAESNGKIIMDRITDCIRTKTQ